MYFSSIKCLVNCYVCGVVHLPLFHFMLGGASKCLSQLDTFALEPLVHFDGFERGVTCEAKAMKVIPEWSRHQCWGQCPFSSFLEEIFLLSSDMFLGELFLFVAIQCPSIQGWREGLPLQRWRWWIRWRDLAFFELEEGVILHLVSYSCTKTMLRLHFGYKSLQFNASVDSKMHVSVCYFCVFLFTSLSVVYTEHFV
jgi:hypothetical protein